MFTCGFFNSVSGDRKYNSKQISQLFDGILTDGVLAHYGTHFAVTPISGMQINIGTGRCWFKHVWGLNDGNTTVTLSPADISANRIDAIVIEINSADTVRNGSIKVIPGVVGGAKPSMINTETLHQHPLAYVTVNAGVTSITASNIQVVVGTSECPFVTSVLESVDLDNLFQQWEGEFDDWFSNLQAQMSGNVVTNLQNQINGLSGNLTTQSQSISTIQQELGSKLNWKTNTPVEVLGETLRNNTQYVLSIDQKYFDYKLLIVSISSIYKNVSTSSTNSSPIFNITLPNLSDITTGTINPSAQVVYYKQNSNNIGLMFMVIPDISRNIVYFLPFTNNSVGYYNATVFNCTANEKIRVGIYNSNGYAPSYNYKINWFGIPNN